MSEENFISGLSTELLDGNLNINKSVDEGRTVLIIGTSQYGPVNRPIKVNSMSDAQEIFGPIYNGSGIGEETLLTGADIVFNNGDSKHDVRLVRISNGTQASIEIKEKISTNGEAKVALKLTSLYPGAIYNQITVEQAVIDGKSCIVIYNPLTKESSAFPFMLNSDNMISNVVALSAAINADPNMYSILKAEAKYYELDTILHMYSKTEELDGNISVATGEESTVGKDMYVDSNGKFFDLYLNQMFASREDEDNLGYTKYDATTTGYQNNKFSLIGPASGLPVSGTTNIANIEAIYRNLEYTFNEINALKCDGLTVATLPYPTQMNGNMAVSIKTNKAKQVKEDYQIGVTDGITTEFAFSAYEAIDPTTVVLKKVNSSGQIITISTDKYTISQVGGSSFNNIAKVELIDTIEKGVTLIISYKSIEFTLTQYNSKAAVLETGDTRAYFMIGSKIFFGAQQTANLEFTYSAKREYKDTEFSIIDANNGIVRIYDTYKVETETQKEEIFTLSWNYLPNWIDISSKTYSLSDGTTGSIFSNSVKYNLLNEVYTKLSDFPAQIIYIPNTYIDDTKIEESEEDGLPIEVNAGFLQQLNKYVEGLAIGYKDAIGIMGVKPCYREEDITSWVNKLINTSIYDTTRAANLMSVRNYRRCVVTAGTVLAVSDNKNAYITGIDGFVAAELSSLPINKTLTNKTFNTYYSLSIPFYISSENVKKINDYQYTTLKQDNDGTIRIAEGFTASAIGSDYKKLSTLMSCMELGNISRDTIKPYIGEFFGDVQKLALETQLTSAFMVLTDTSKGEAPVKNISFELTQNLAQKQNGIVNLNYVIIPNFELTKVIGTIKLSLE